MAPAGKAAKAEAAWREAWVGSPFTGEVALADDEEKLIVRCKEVSAKYGTDAEVLDDGRTVGIAVGDDVVFGIVKRSGKAPIVVNLWRKKRKKRDGEGEAFPERKKGRESLPPLLAGELTGVVRNTSPNTGDFFIECEEIFAEFGRDAKIKYDDMPEGIELGEAISFEVDPPNCDTAAPVAINVRKASKEQADVALARGFRRKGGGKGGSKSGVSKGLPVNRTQATMRMLGVVKRPSPNTGRHFVFCQDISDVYGRDAQIPLDQVPEGGLKIGDRISFDIEDDGNYLGVPMARNVALAKGAKGAAKVSVSHADMGDGEDDAGDDLELEERDDEAPEEVHLGQEELAEMEATEKAEAELSKRSGGAEAVGDGRAAPRDQDKKAARRRVGAEEAPAEPVPEDPETTEGWVALQDKLFPGLSKLKKGWIRIRSKSRGLVYFYNVDTGKSSPTEPK